MLMNQKGSEFLFVGSFKHVPREFVLCVTSNLVEVHSGPGGQLKQMQTAEIPHQERHTAFLLEFLPCLKYKLVRSPD